MNELNEKELVMLDRVVAAVVGRVVTEQEQNEAELKQFNELMRAAATVTYPDRSNDGNTFFVPSKATAGKFDGNEWAVVGMKPEDYELAEQIGKSLANMMEDKRKG